MDWYQIPEKSAGEKRLILSWWIYKLFGETGLNIIAFFVTLITFTVNKELRKNSHNFFKVLYDYTKDKKYKNNLINCFKNILGYSYSLTDRIEVFCGKYDTKNIIFEDKEVEKTFLDLVKNKQNIFLLTNHVGNVDVMRALINSGDEKPQVYIFQQKDHCQIFNNFLDKIEQKSDKLKLLPVEELDITTTFEIDERSETKLFFMAGDRISANNPNKIFELELFGKTIKLPQGAFKIAKIFGNNIFFVSCIKNKNKYIIYLKSCNIIDEEHIKTEYLDFLKEMILKFPHQFFHFYNFFNIGDEKT